MTTILLCWYALGWAAIGLYCMDEDVLLLEDLLVMLFGGIAFLSFLFLYLSKRGDLIIWRRK